VKKSLAILTATILALTTFGAATVPAAAQVGFSIQGPGGGFSVNTGPRRGFYSQNGWQYYNGYRGQRSPRAGWRNHNGWYFPPAAFTAPRSGFYSQNGWQYYNGYRGQRAPRAGWRNYNGWYFPPAAFAAIIGGSIANSIANSRGNTAHVNWCRAQYRSYDVNTDTFQPYNGPRRQCNSPYN